MPDWYIVYSNDGETDVMTVSDEFAETEADARRELAYSLPSATIIQVTQAPSEIPDDLDAISLEEAEQVMDDPDSIHLKAPGGSIQCERALDGGEWRGA